MASVPERNLSGYICRGAQTSWSNALTINHKKARLCLWPFMWVQLHSFFFFKASVIITDDPKMEVKIKLSCLTWERVRLYCGLMAQVALQIFSTTAGFPLTTQSFLWSLWVFHFSLPGERNPALSNPGAKENMCALSFIKPVPRHRQNCANPL